VAKVDNGKTMKWAVLACSITGWAAAQMTPYTLKVEPGPGLIAITFSTQSNHVSAYLPDDVAPGEQFSGTMEGQPNYSLEFAGQQVRVRDGDFRWIMPGVQPGEFVSLILKDFRGKELGRASILVAASRPRQCWLNPGTRSWCERPNAWWGRLHTRCGRVLPNRRETCGVSISRQ